MKRTSALRRRPLAVACLLGSALWASGLAAEVTAGPYLQNLTSTAVTICWETGQLLRGTVEYGRGSSIEHRIAEQVPAARHEVRIEGLRPATRYVYRVSGMPAGEGVPFRTAPPPGTPKFRLAVYGDSRSNPQMHARIAEAIRKADPDLVLHTGDIVGRGRETHRWKPEFFDPARNLLARVSLWPCLGNHEDESPNYYRFFSLPGRESWYSFDWGNARFICLDSCLPMAPGTEQYEWLERELKATKAPWKIAFFHHPPFSAHPRRGMSDTRRHWAPLFQKYGVQVVFNGHDHSYVRTKRIDAEGKPDERGTVYVISGGGGAGVYPVTEKPYVATALAAHHYVIVDFEGEVARARAYDVK
ncbi:MAG: metallophosphoesterase, partial [Armatimonadota bacterium]